MFMSTFLKKHSQSLERKKSVTKLALIPHCTYSIYTNMTVFLYIYKEIYNQDTNIPCMIDAIRFYHFLQVLSERCKALFIGHCNAATLLKTIDHYLPNSTQCTTPEVKMNAVPQCSSWCRDGNASTAIHSNTDAVEYE